MPTVILRKTNGEKIALNIDNISSVKQGKKCVYEPGLFAYYALCKNHRYEPTDEYSVVCMVNGDMHRIDSSLHEILDMLHREEEAQR